MIKQRKNAGTCWDKNEKAIQEKITIQLEERNVKVMVKEGRLKRHRQRVKQYRQNRTFQNNESKFHQQVGGNDTKTYQQLDAREIEQFWNKIWQPREYDKKAESISNVTKDLKRLEEGQKAGIHIDLHKTTLKMLNWKTPGHDGIHRFWFKKFPTIHDRLALERNRCLQEIHVTKWMTKGKITLI